MFVHGFGVGIGLEVWSLEWIFGVGVFFFSPSGYVLRSIYVSTVAMYEYEYKYEGFSVVPVVRTCVG